MKKYGSLIVYAVIFFMELIALAIGIEVDSTGCIVSSSIAVIVTLAAGIVILCSDGFCGGD